MAFLSVRELVGLAALRGQEHRPLMLCDNGEVWSFPRLVDVCFRFGRVLIVAKTCVMAEDVFSVPVDDVLTPSSLLAYAAQFGFADKPLAISDSSGFGYYVTEEACESIMGRFVVDISVCEARSM